MTTKSGKHANKTFGSAKDKSAKVVDMRKVAALSAGAAGVIAGAAIAFGATPAMAAEANVAPVNTIDPAKEQNLVDANKSNSKTSDDSKATKKNEASKDETPNSEVKKEAKKEESKEAKEEPKKEQTKPAEQSVAKTDGNTDVTKTEAGSKVESIASADDKDVKQDTAKNSTPAGNVAKSRKKRDLSAENQKQGEPVVGTDRDANPEPSVSDQINISEDTKNSVPNMYAWGSSNNTYIKSGQSNTVTFNFAKPTDGSKITSIAIFPAQNNSLTTDKGRNAAEYYSGNTGLHQSYSGEYTFTPNTDGSAKLEMTPLFRDGNLNSGVAYAANRCIYVYGKKDGGNEVLLYKTNIARAATLIPPKTAGSIVLKYNEELTAEQIQNKLKAALDAPTEAKNGMSIREQIKTASTSKGVGGNTGANGAFVQTPDTAENKVIINDQRAYNQGDVTKFNATTSKPGATETTYITTVRTLKTHLITDTGYNSDDLPLTVARYDDRIDKPIVEDADPSKVSDDVKTEIKKKLARLNHVPEDTVTIGTDGTVTINFDGVDAKDAPKIPLRNLVLKQLKDTEYTVPTGDKAAFVYNPLDYSKDEIARIKKAIFDANKGNKELGLSEKDYENQISLSYLKGNFTTSGQANQGISNGRQENTITVKIKTDKAVAEFTSDVTKSKLTKFVNIREDYDVTWKNNKIDGRDSDEGLTWSEDHKTIIYRYDPTKAVAFKSSDVTKLLTATPKAGKEGLRVLKGDEHVDHEGEPGKDKKSHVYYVIDSNGEPTGALTLGIMNSGYWKGDPQITGTEKNMGDVLAKADSYTWNDGAEPVILASKDGKIYRARLFVAPYGMESYQYVYTHPDGKNPNNTSKAINVIFVPQTNHKKADLKASVDKHAVTKDEKKTPTDSKYYNASDAKKAAYDEALKKANDALKEAGDTEDSKLSEDLKARIDNATIQLDKAREALDGAKTDKTKLEQDIKDQGNPKKDNTAASGTYETDKYKNVTEPSFLKDDGKTPDTKKNEAASAAKTAYDEALAEAEKVKADANATQKAVDDAKAKLDAARKELDNYSTNKDKLNAAIAEHGKVKDGRDAHGAQTLANADTAYQNATEEERNAYDEAVKKANELSKDPKASQKDVNAAITALEAAKAKLDAKATNKTKLAVAVQQTFDNPDPDNTNGKKSTFYKNALNKKKNGSDDEKTKAAAAIKAYDDALKAAKDLLEDKNGKATQAQVDAAVKALTDAEDKLHEYSTDKNDLTKALADNIDGYLKPAYFNAFDKSLGTGADAEAAKKAFKEYNDAYHAAKELKAKFANADPAQQPTDEDCKKAKEALEKARQVIDTYATDTSKLSAAFWNDLAIQNSPAYKNAAALAGKKNPTKDEKAQVEAAKKIKQAYDDAVAKLHKAFSNTLDQDKDAQGTPFAKIPDAKGDPTSKNYLDGVQAHANGEPLDRDVTDILTAMNKAAADLNQFATNTDKLQESINKDTDTQKNPAYKNAKDPHKLGADGLEDTSGYAAIKEKATAYDNALKDAKALMVKPDATQEEVNDALKKLDDARTALDAYKTNVEDLKKSVEAHGSTDGPATKEGTVTSDVYRNASDPHFLTADGKPDDSRNSAAKEAKKAYDAALLKAQDLLKKADPDSKTPLDAQPIQKEIDAALTTLNEKRKALDAYKTDTSKLDEEAKKSTAEGTTVADADFEATPEFKNAKAKTSNGVENTDVTAYKEALKKARDLVKAATSTDPSTKNSDRPTQEEVDEALAALKKAKKQIEDNYKTDTSKLEEAKKYAEDAFKKTPEYKNALAKKAAGDQVAISRLGKDGEQTGFDNVLKKVTDKLNDNDWKGKVTQKFVDELLKKLQESQGDITKNYKTDVTPLSNEVGDKDQDGKLVTPKFEESIPYKNALAKKNAGDNDATAKLKAYADKLKAAQDLIAQVNSTDPNADPDKKPTQQQVDDALAALKKAKQDIDDAFKTNASALKNEADDKDEHGNAKQEADKFENSTEYKNALAKTDADGKKDVQTYKDALQKANGLLSKFDENGKPKADAKDVPSQKEVDEALKNLKEIKDKITKNYVTSPHDLQQEVDKSKDGKDDTSADVFENTPEFKNATAKGDDAAKKALDEYNEKLKAAKGLLDAFDRTTGKPKDQLPQGMDKAPTQKELDDALDALKAVKKKITDGYKTDPSKLKSEADADGDFTKTPEYQNAQAKDDDASKQALEAYKTALDDAKKVLGDANATQAQVDDALKKLQDAKSKLSDGYKTNKSDLTVEAGKDSDFTKTPEYQNAQAKGDDASKKALDDYKKALDEANTVLGDKNATQAQVDEALKKLQDAKSKLSDGYKTNKSDLTAEAGKDSDFTKSPEYQNAAGSPEAEAYKKALEDANKVLGDKNATQAQVDEALRKLQDAKKKLADSHKTDKSDLNTEAGKDSDFRKSIPFIIGKAADLAEYQQALNDANSVLKDPNATQAQVDQALRRLRAAKQKLIDSYNRLINSGSGVGSGSDHDFGTDTDVNTGVGVNDVNNTSVNNVVDKGALQAEVDQALGDVSANANGVVADSSLVSEFNAALNYARSVLADANATQGQVDSALARLRAARAALRAGMLAARNSAGMNLKRGDVSGVNTGASSSVFAALAAVFAGLGVAGAASKRRKHSAR